MAVKRKARRFVQLLAEQLKSDNVSKNHVQDLRTAFHSAVADLPQGPLKTELGERLKVYFKKLKLYCKENKTADPAPSADENDASGDNHVSSAPVSWQPDAKLVFPYNLYNKKGYKINPVAMENIDQKTHQQIYKCLLSTQMQMMSEEKILALLAEMRGHSAKKETDPSSSTEWVDDLMILANILISQRDPAAFQKVMALFNNKLSATVHVLLTGKKPKRVHNLKKKVFQFIQLFHMKHQTLSGFTQPPKYEDLMAALLSVYVDLEVADARKQDETERIVTGKKLASAVSLFLQNAPQYAVDVIAQLDSLTDETLTLLYPLMWKVLKKPQISAAADYTKYICTVRKVMQFLQDEDQIVMAGSQVAAPKHYLSWLEERDASLLDEMPETKHFRGVHITSFLLREASLDVIDQLLNVVTADMDQETVEPTADPGEDDVDAAQEHVGSVVVDVQEIEEEPLFFIDKTADSKTTEEMKVAYADRGGVEDQDDEDGDDAESIEVHDADLDKMLAEMDESSDDEELKAHSDDDSISDGDDNQDDSSYPKKSIVSSTDKALSDLVRGGEDSCSMLNEFVLTPEKVVSPLKEGQSPRATKRWITAKVDEPASPEVISSALDETHSDTGIDTATHDEDEDSCDDFDTTVIDIKKPPPRIVTEVSPSNVPVRLVAIEKTDESSASDIIPRMPHSADSPRIKSPERPLCMNFPKLGSPKSSRAKSHKLLSLDAQSESTRLVSAEEVEAEWSSLIDSPVKDSGSQENRDPKQGGSPSVNKRQSNVRPECTPTKRTRRTSRRMSATENEVETGLHGGDPLSTPTRVRVAHDGENKMDEDGKMSDDVSDLYAVLNSPGVMTRRRRRTISDTSEMSDVSDLNVSLRSRIGMVPGSKETVSTSSSPVGYGLRRRSMPASPRKVSSPAAKLKSIPEDAPKTRVDALRSEAGSTPRSPKIVLSDSSPKRTPRSRRRLSELEEHIEVDESISFRKTPSPKKATSPKTPTRTLRRRSEVGSAKK